MFRVELGLRSICGVPETSEAGVPNLGLPAGLTALALGAWLLLEGCHCFEIPVQLLGEVGKLTLT